MVAILRMKEICHEFIIEIVTSVGSDFDRFAYALLFPRYWARELYDCDTVK